MQEMKDLQDMEGFNDEVKNGKDSVSQNKIELVNGYPSCKKHGAMNKVSKDGIWRCLTCNEGCYYQK